MLLAYLAVAILLVVLAILWLRWRQLAREAFIRDYAFPQGLLDRLAKHRPGLTLKDRALVARGLRQFFLTYLRSGRRFVSMPSQVADDLWHEFILYTKSYDAFCRQAFGRFLHHTPAVVLGEQQQSNAGLRRCWHWACREENIDPQHPSRLPLLFALDAKLGIADGFIYAPNCKVLAPGGTGTAYCGADLGSGSGSDGGSGDDSSSDGGDGGGCGGGD
jgi:hypothetical protein